MADQDLDLTEYNGGSLVATVAVFLSLSWFAFSLRTYTRAVLMKSFQIDDWLMLVAQIIFTASCAFILEGVKKGMGKHNAAITDDDEKVLALMWQALGTATYVIDMMFIKLSIGIFLLRLCVQRVYIYILRVSLVVVAIWSAAVFIWDIFQCTPVEKQWDYRITGGHCASADQIVSAAYGISVMTIVSDWLYALLPIPMLWSVKMTKQAKVTVILILGLGVFASVATLIRLRFLSKLEITDDILFAGTDAMVWTLIEPGVAIVASSLATIRPLLRAMRIRGFDSTDRTPSTGISAGAHRRTPGSMPGYGRDDVSLHSVDRDDGKSNSSTRAIGLTFAGRKQDERVNQPPPRRPSDSKSEVYVIEGNKSSPTWSAQEFRGGCRSLEEIHDLEEQSQDHSHVGLGSSKRR